MALLGIQAEMPCEGNIPVPRHYSDWNLNVNTNGRVWLSNDVDDIYKNRNYCNGALLLPSPDQHLVQSKEVMKQTMLKQEAIFRDQIRELHRIYWRQRELMDEMKKNELLEHHSQQGTLQSNPFLPRYLCEDAQKTSYAFSLPGVNPAFNQLSISTAKNDPSLSHFEDRKFVQSGPDPSQSKFSSKSCELESSKKFGKMVLDLELPPSQYIDSEDEESLQKVPEVSDHPMNRISEAVHKSDWQPDHGSGGFNSVFQEDNVNPGSSSSKRKFLADLNEPIKLEEDSVTMSMYLPDLNEPNKIGEKVAGASKFLVDLNEPVELQEDTALPSEFQSPLATNTNFSCQDLAQRSIEVPSTDITHNNAGRGSKTCSSKLHLEKYDDDAGQRSNITSLSPGFVEELSTSLKNIDLKQAHEPETCHFMNQRKRKSCGEGLESLEKDLPSNSNPVSVSACNIGTSSRLLSLTDIGNSKPSPVSSPKKCIRDIVRTPIIVQALPCFNSSLWLRKHSKASITGPGVAGKTSYHGKSSKFSPKFDSASFHQRSFCNGSRAESKALQSHPPFADSNVLDVSKENQLSLECHCPTKFSTLSMEIKSAECMNSDFRTQSSSSDGERKLEDTVMGLAWSKTKLVPKRRRGRRSESAAQVETCQNPSEDEDIKNGANDGVSNISLDCDLLPESEESEEQVTSHKLVVKGGPDQQISCFGAATDMNLCIKDDESSLSPFLLTELDLEGPVSPENKESSPPRGNSDENQAETSSELLAKEDGGVQEDFTRNAAEVIVSGEEDGDLQAELSMNAATALVSISSSVFQTCPEKAACEPSKPSRSDGLYWFAKIVSSVVDDPDSELGVALSSKNSGDCKEYVFNGLDYFEAMTLNLVETNVDEEDWFKTNDQIDEKEEASGGTYFPSQQRRGRIRRQRQQRKDFQTEVLPSLASLSRCEVTEDLQTIEGLIEAANGLRGTVCIRSTSRNGRARGRKHLFISTSNLTDITICSPSKRTSFMEKDVKERSLIGWGRITRRRRGPRSPSANPWLR